MDVTLLPIDAATDHALATAPAIAPIQALQVAMQKEAPAAELIEQLVTTNHFFTEGLYVRELVMREGSCIVGALHRTRHLFLLTQGRILIEDGEGSREMQAPEMVETLPGAKRVIIALTDASMLTFHVTDETDPEVIELAITVPEDGLPVMRGPRRNVL